MSAEKPIQGLDALFNVECATEPAELAKEVRVDDLRESFNEHVRFVFARQQRWLEAYLCAWVAETGIKPSEAELVQESKPGMVVFRVQRRRTE